MEIRQNVRRLSTRQILVAVAVLFVFAVALAARCAVATSTAVHSSGSDKPSVTSGFVAPDAAERNQQLHDAQLSKAEATHGY